MNRVISFRTRSTLVFLSLLVILLAGCGGGSGDATDTTADDYQLSGVNFSPYIDDQDPNRGALIDVAQLSARMAIIHPYTRWIRTFGMADGLEHSGRIAHSMGLKAALGAWLGSDRTTNEVQIQNLIAAAKAGDADLVIVGSEVLLRDDLPASALIDYIARVKQALPDMTVGYAEVYRELLEHPDVMAAVDVVIANYYPYWEGIAIEVAVQNLHGWHAQVTTAAQGKPVLIGETGWPSAGDSVGRAVPSPKNAAFYFLNFTSWARALDVDYFSGQCQVLRAHRRL